MVNRVGALTAIAITVASFHTFRMISSILSSRDTSSDDVASSRMSTWEGFRMLLAKQNSCFSPELRFEPSSEISASVGKQNSRFEIALSLAD